jgi:hypothetical protein
MKSRFFIFLINIIFYQKVIQIILLSIFIQFQKNASLHSNVTLKSNFMDLIPNDVNFYLFNIKILLIGYIL